MPSRIRDIAASILCLVLVVCCVWVAHDVHMALTALPDTFQTLNATIASAQPVIAKAGDALDTINRPCGSGHPCGTLANADKAVQRLTDLQTTAQFQVRQSGTLIAATTQNLDATTAHLDKTLDSFAGLALAGQTTLQTADTALLGAPALVGSANETVKHFDALVTSQDVKTLSTSLAATSVEVAGISKDVRREADVLTAPPQKHWYNGIVLTGKVIKSCCVPPLF
jgi:hypothetical protein